MKKFLYCNQVPKNRLEDVQDLAIFIRNNLQIDISLGDTYRLWSDISESWSAGWLNIDAHYEDMTREDFILYEMQKRGFILG